MNSRKLRMVSSKLCVVAALLVLLPSGIAPQAQSVPNGGAAERAPGSTTSKTVAASGPGVNRARALFSGDSAGGLLTQPSVSFLAHRDFVAADVAARFAQADLNGDGITDLVVPNGNTGGTNISVLLGNADGSFQPALFFSTGGLGPSTVVIADFNGDGKKDVAVTTLSGVSVLLGDGKGNFGAPATFTAGSSPAELVAVDLNGDQILDLAVANTESNNVSILLGDGHGGFTPGATVAVGMGRWESPPVISTTTGIRTWWWPTPASASPRDLTQIRWPSCWGGATAVFSPPHSFRWRRALLAWL